MIDCFSRRVVGFAIADHMRTELIMDALRMAVIHRNPPSGVIFHSDRGAQYTSYDFRDFCRANGVRPSVGRTGVCYDNAVAESFFATLKKEVIHLHPWPTLALLRSPRPAPPTVLDRRDFVEAAPALPGDPRIRLPPASVRRYDGE